MTKISILFGKNSFFNILPITTATISVSAFSSSAIDNTRKFGIGSPYKSDIVFISGCENPSHFLLPHEIQTNHEI